MLTALWRCLWKGSRGRAPRKCLRRNHALSCRPCLESLESRELPAVLGSGLFAPVVPNAPSISQAPMLPGCTRPICVTVAENSPQTVIDMGPVFAAIPGIQYQDGLQLAVLGEHELGAGPDGIVRLRADPHLSERTIRHGDDRCVRHRCGRSISAADAPGNGPPAKPGGSNWCRGHSPRSAGIGVPRHLAVVSRSPLRSG